MGFRARADSYEPDVWIRIDRCASLNLPARLFDAKRTVADSRRTPGAGSHGGAGRCGPAEHGDRTRRRTSRAGQAADARLRADGGRRPRSCGPSRRSRGSGSRSSGSCCSSPASTWRRCCSRARRIVSARSACATALGASRCAHHPPVRGRRPDARRSSAAPRRSSSPAGAPICSSAFSLPSPIPQRLHIGVDRRLIGVHGDARRIRGGPARRSCPALQATRGNLVASMRMDNGLGRRRSRLRSAFMVAQIAGSTLFLTTALLFLRSFWTQATPNPGFETDRTFSCSSSSRRTSTTTRRDRERSSTTSSNACARCPASNAWRLAIAFPFYVGFPKSHKGLGRRDRLRDDRVPGRVRLRGRPRLHGGARRPDAVRHGVQRADDRRRRRRRS